MLCALIPLALIGFSPLVAAENCGPQTKSCAGSFLEDDLSKDIQSLRDASLQKTEEVLRDRGFQDFVAEARDRNQGPKVRTSLAFEKDPLLHTLPDSRFPQPPSCYVFISFSLNEKALLNLAVEAKKCGATLILRGFKEGSYTKTAKALQKIILKTGQGVLIDPELFTLFAVIAVPTIVLLNPVPLLSTERVQTPIHDRLQGHVSLQYALETFAKEGDLASEAQALLKDGATR